MRQKNIAKPQRGISLAGKIKRAAKFREGLYLKQHRRDKENFDEMVMIRNIEFSSMCEHHMVPFFGRVHIAYYPDNKLVGLSKLPRAVDALARRLQIQERLTTQLRDAIEEALNPRGVAIALEATHMCMVMRGVQKQGALTVTRAFSGLFEEESRRAEFLNAIRE